MGRYDDDDELDIDLTLYDSIKEDRRPSGRNSKGENKRNNSKNHKRKRRRKKRWPRVLFTFVTFIFAVIVCMWAIIKYVPGSKKFLLANCSGPLLRCVLDEDTYNKIYDDFDGAVVNDGVDKSKFKGYYTVALFGVDSRDSKLDAGVNSDSIIIVSINQDTGKIVMSSIYRDTWLNIPNDDGTSSKRFRKINSAI